MFTNEDTERARAEVERLCAGEKDADGKGGKGGGAGKACLNLTPAQLLVIAGFLSGSLEVTSVLVDKEQTVEIVLSGSLKRRTQLDRIMEQIGRMPFEQVVRSIVENSM